MPKIVILKNKNKLIMRNVKCPVALHSGAYLEGRRNSPQHGTSTKFSDHLSLFFLTKYPETTTTKILISCILHETLAEHVALNIVRYPHNLLFPQCLPTFINFIYLDPSLTLNSMDENNTPHLFSHTQGSAGHKSDRRVPFKSGVRELLKQSKH